MPVTRIWELKSDSTKSFDSDKTFQASGEGSQGLGVHIMPDNPVELQEAL